MAKIIVPAILSAALFLSCSSQAGIAAKQDAPATIADKDGREYSSSTFIIAVASGDTEETALALAQEYGLSIVYIMKTMRMCVLSAGQNLTETENSSILGKLRQDSRVLSAERDYVIRLHDSQPSATSSTIMRANPTANPIVQTSVFSSLVASGMSSSTTT